MPPRRPRIPAALGRLPVLALPLLALAACVSPRQQVQDREDSLAAAGFIVKPANTPERQSMLNSLPPHRFVMRTNGDTVTFVYADPLVCDCLYVGTQQAYDRYRRAAEAKHIADEEELTAESYNGPAWSWPAWGPWPDYYAFGPGRGW